MYRGSSTVIAIAAEDTVGYVDVCIYSNGNGREQHAVYLSRRCTRYATRSFVEVFFGKCDADSSLTPGSNDPLRAHKLHEGRAARHRCVPRKGRPFGSVCS